MSMNDLQGDESQRDAHPPTDLTGFQRDLLFAVVRVANRPATGVAVKSELECYYDEEINHGRFYQNLRELIDDDLVEKRPVDGRTNAHWLTDEAYERLQAHHRWEADCLCGDRPERPHARY